MTAIGVVFGGPSPEHDISILTGLQAARALAEGGAEVACLYWAKTGEWLRVPTSAEAASFLDPSPAGSTPLDLAVPGGFSERRRLRSAPLEVGAILNCCHGGPGEDGTLTGLLMLAGYKVSGPHPEACALAMDKLATGAVAEGAGIPTIDTVALTDQLDSVDLPTPWVVKPRFGGSSIGVEAGVSDLATARALARTGAGRAGVIIQPFLDGWVDLHIAVRTFPELSVSAIERPLREGSGIYGYGDKYLSGGVGMDSAPRELPAAVPDELTARIGDLATRLVAAAGLTGAVRVDFLWDGHDRLALCEVNAIPGAWGAYLWQAVGVSRRQLLGDLVAEATQGSTRRPQWSATSDGAALRVAGSVASKLA
jgi:D-alanine-D-alanine ligase